MVKKEYQKKRKEHSYGGIVPIIGPSSCGKSCVLEELGRRGYDTHHEIAKQVINERYGYIKEGDSKEDIEKEIETRERIMYGRQEKLESSLLENPGFHFMERSIIGVFAFSDFYLGHVPKDFDMDKNLKSRYFKVFNLKDLEDFKKTKSRVESSKEEAEKVQKKVLEYYNSFGIDPVDVPNFSNKKARNVKKRADFILDNLGLPYLNK